MKKQSNKEAILSFVAKNQKSSQPQIVAGTKINRETVRVTINKMVAAGELTSTKENNKNVYSVKAESPKTPKRVKPRKITSAHTVTAVPDAKVKRTTPAVVRTAKGKIGLVYPNEPQVTVKKGIISEFKTIVHLVKENTMQPIVHNGHAKKILVDPSSITVITPASVIRKSSAKTKRASTKGESQKDTTKYILDGNVFGKGRLIQAIIAKFVTEHKPSLAQLSEAFPAKDIHPKLFVHFDEAVRVNTETKHNRFFAKDKAADGIKLNGGAVIAVTNQVTSEVINKMLAVVPKHGINVTVA